VYFESLTDNTTKFPTIDSERDELETNPNWADPHGDRMFGLLALGEDEEVD
jgi:hypothetical protein